MTELARAVDRKRVRIDVAALGAPGSLVESLAGLDTRCVLLNGSSFANTVVFSRLLRGIDVVHFNVGGTRWRAIARLSSNAQVVTHVHGPTDTAVELFRAGSPAHAAYFKRTYLYFADAVIGCSDWVRKAVASSVPGSPVPLVRQWPGIDVSRYARGRSIRSELGLAEGALVVAFVGRLVQQKGVDHFVASMREVLCERADMAAIVVGDGPMRDQVDHLMVDFPRRVVAVGAQSDIGPYLASADLFVLSSEWEAFGIVSLEAMAAGLPVVGFDVDGVAEVVENGITGVLVPHRDRAALCAAILDLASCRETRARMGEAGRARVSARFSSRVMADHLTALYERLVA